MSVLKKNAILNPKQVKHTYTIHVKHGDTLSSLADDFATNISTIKALNRGCLKKNTHLKLNQVLVMPKHSREIILTLPVIIVQALDYYRKYGNIETMDAKHFAGIDISRGTLIRYLVSTFGHKRSALADLVNSRVWHLRDKTYNQYVSIITTNRLLLHYRRELVYRLICAMVYMNIRIPNCFSPEDKKRMYMNHIKRVQH